MSLARDTPYYQDTWQHEAYGIGGYARYKEATAKVREHASEILTVQWNGTEILVCEICGRARPVAVQLRGAGMAEKTVAKDKFNRQLQKTSLTDSCKRQV